MEFFFLVKKVLYVLGISIKYFVDYQKDNVLKVDFKRKKGHNQFPLILEECK